MTLERSYDTLIWDWNGTLLDDIALVIDIVNEILRDHHLQTMSVQRYKELFDFPVEQFYQRAGMDLTRVDFASIGACFHQSFEQQMSRVGLFPQAADALAAVRAMGVHQYLLSSTEHETLVRTVAGFELTDAFDDVRGISDRLARGKTEAGTELIESHGIDASHALMIGDTRHDWEVARACGMDCVLLSTGYQSYARLVSLGCPVLQSIDDIPAYLIQC